MGCMVCIESMGLVQQLVSVRVILTHTLSSLNLEEFKQV